jgi:hypothetical protein
MWVGSKSDAALKPTVVPRRPDRRSETNQRKQRLTASRGTHKTPTEARLGIIGANMTNLRRPLHLDGPPHPLALAWRSTNFQ